jgi:hemerythrin
MPLTWSEKMTTGLADIDAHHQELIRQTNALHEAMAQGKSRQEIIKVLDFMLEYSAMHFQKEEEYMDQYKCPAALLNKRSHEAFVRRAKGLREQLNREGATSKLVLETYQQLADWLVDHILNTDTQLYPYVKKATGG